MASLTTTSLWTYIFLGLFVVFLFFGKSTFLKTYYEVSAIIGGLFIAWYFIFRKEELPPQ